MKLRQFILALGILSAAAVHADTYTVAGIPFKADAPAGFCPLGDSPTEREILRLQREGMTAKAEVIQLVGDCKELAAIRAGRKNHLARFAMIAVTKTQGEVKPVGLTRAQFIEATAKAQPVPRVDEKEASRAMQEKLQRKDVGVSESSTEIVGHDDEAIYLVTHARFKQGGSTIPGTLLSAVTVVKSLPVSVSLVQTQDADPAAQPVDQTLRDYLHDFLRQN